MGWASRTRSEQGGDPGPPSSMTCPTESVAIARTAARALGPISGALMEFVEPLRGETDSLADYQTLITIGALAWNLASLPEGEGDEMLGRAMRESDFEDPVTVRALLHNLAQRKREIYPHDRRIILQYEVSKTPDGFHVQAAAAALHEA